MNILEGKQSIQDIQRQCTVLLYWPNCNFKTLSLDLCILFKVVLWVFLGATTAWWQESEWQSTNCLHLLNPAPSELPSKSQSREILLDVIGQNWFCFVFQWLLCRQQKMKFFFHYLFIYFFNLHWSLCGWYKWQPNNFCQTSSSTAVPNSTRHDRLSIWTHYLSSQRYKNRFIPPVDLSSWVESWGYYFVNIVYSVFFMEATCFSLSTGCLVQTADTCW